jgi:hypothetical protein
MSKRARISFFDGLRQTEPNRGKPDIGPEHLWRFEFDLGVKKLVSTSSVIAPTTVVSAIH